MIVQVLLALGIAELSMTANVARWMQTAARIWLIYPFVVSSEKESL
jgi:hypothetical protein